MQMRKKYLEHKRSRHLIIVPVRMGGGTTMHYDTCPLWVHACALDPKVLADALKDAGAYMSHCFRRSNWHL
jgi:hypothetical protein